MKQRNLLLCIGASSLALSLWVTPVLAQDVPDAANAMVEHVMADPVSSVGLMLQFVSTAEDSHLQMLGDAMQSSPHIATPQFAQAISEAVASDPSMAHAVSRLSWFVSGPQAEQMGVGLHMAFQPMMSTGDAHGMNTLEQAIVNSSHSMKTAFNAVSATRGSGVVAGARLQVGARTRDAPTTGKGSGGGFSLPSPN
ncbi:hypothetical protein [Pseudovibrio sp. SCP19]|uniref:hypothetical protein n=1 Tax=Pseudovibrio sp. SCP19 TaxID=3141374 RepID=UPI00333C337C